MRNHQSPHGDYDYIIGVINLVENFKIEKVIFNCGQYNDLEQGLIKVLDKKKIQYYSCIKKLKLVIDLIILIYSYLI